MAERISQEEMQNYIKEGKAKVITQAPERISAAEMSSFMEQGKAKPVEDNYKQGFLDGPTMDSLRNGILLGYGPQFEAAVEYLVGHASGQGDLVDPYTVRRDRVSDRYEKHKAKNPKTWAAGNVGGAVLGAIPAAGLTAVKGASALQRAGSAAKIGAGYGAISNPGDTEGKLSGLQIEDRLKNAAIGAGTGAVVQGGLDLGAAAARGSKSGLRKVGEYLQDNSAQRENVDEIVEAARRLGFEVTPGMKAAKGTIVPDLESSLNQSPGLGGWLTRKSIGKVQKGLEGAVDDVTDASTGALTPYEVGENIKTLIVADTGEKLAPATMVMDDMVQKFGKLPAREKGFKAVANNLRNMKPVKLRPKEAFSTKIMNLADDLENVKTLEDVRSLRQSVGKELGDARNSRDQSMIQVLSPAYKKLTGLEQRTLKRGIISMGGRNNKQRAVDNLSSLRSANKTYSGEMNRIQDFSKATRLRKSDSPQAFMDTMENMPSESLYKKMGNTSDLRAMKALREQYPEAFENVRQRKLMEMFEKSQLPDGDVSPRKLMTQTRRLPSDAKEILFQDKMGKLGDIETVTQSIPGMVGPSGTPKGLSVYDYINPVMHAKDLGRYGAYKSLGSDTAKNLGERLSGLSTGTVAQDALGKTGRMSGLLGATREGVMTEQKENPVFTDEKLFNLIEKNPDLIDRIQNEKLKEKLKGYMESRPSFTKEKVPDKEAQQQYLKGN